MSSAAKPSKPFIRKATPQDCLELAPKMREEDVRECWVGYRMSPLDALQGGLAASIGCFTVEWDGEPVAMFGLVAQNEKWGAPWMLASERLKDIRKDFLRQCKPVLRSMMEKRPYLTNMVWSGNKVHIKWLQWLGFAIGPGIPMGPDGELFHVFSKVTFPCVDSQQPLSP